ncbi:MAG: hypothetical protein GX259_06605, partial [Bacteroidales bacterium]|nr:hypothetical protein [Bacteroidales bacterium]
KLENVKIDRTGNKNIIRSSIDGLKIEVVGKNNLKNHGWSLIDVSKNTTIQGSDTLNIQNTQNNLGINITASANLTIKDCHLNVTSVGAGIRGWTNESLIFDNATVKVRGSGEGSIFEFKEINLNNTFISKPDGAKITNGKITNAGGEIIKDTVKIEPIIGYDLWICGTQVTNANKNNLSVIDGVTGTVKYNPTTTTLTLDNADISCTTTSGISSEVDGLKIYLIGNNIIANNGNSSTISLVANSNIVGSGTLDVINAATNGGAIYANNCTLLISNCTVNAIGGANGIRGTSNNTLIIEKATVSAIGNTEGSIMDFKIITFTNCVISKPVGAVFNNSIRAICNTLGNIITDTVKIVPAYDLWICGTQITDANKDDLTVINGVTGTAKYNTTTKILTLNNADISCTTTPGISSEIDELKIDLIGNNTIANNGTSSTVSLFANGKIMGSGTLDVVNAATNGCAIYANNCSLLISNCTVNATGGANGIKGTSNNAITFDKAAVSAIGNVEGSIMGFETITFTNCAISKPTGAVFNGTIKAICDTLGNIIKDTVRIAPVYDLWICGTQVTTS